MGKQDKREHGQNRQEPEYSEERLEELLEKIEPYWDDLLRQGGIARKFDMSPTPTYRLKFRQKLTGSRDGALKHIHVGKNKALAEKLMEVILEEREESEVRQRWGLRYKYGPDKRPQVEPEETRTDGPENPQNELDERALRIKRMVEKQAGFGGGEVPNPTGGAY